MLELAMNIPSAIILLIIGVAMVLAVRRMRRKGLCDCDEKCGDSGGCAGCNAVDNMIADMEQRVTAGCRQP